MIFGGGLLGLFAGAYFWWPKAFGHFLSETLGKWHFGLMLAGLNLTFGAMHILGLQGMSRRYFTYSANQGFAFWNMVASIGAFTMGAGALVFAVNMWRSWRKHRANPVDVGPDPWDARSLEWMVPSPTPEYNFAEIPEVSELDEFWHRKYGHDDEHRAVRIAKTEDVVEKTGATGIHLPSPSYWPLVLACGFPLLCYGLMFHKERFSGPGTGEPIQFVPWAIGVGLLGVIIIAVSLFGWIMEPSTDPDDGHSHDDHGDSQSDHAGDLPAGEGELVSVGGGALVSGDGGDAGDSATSKNEDPA